MAILDEIRPTRRQRVYDLVRDAGVDVSHWERTKGESSSAASNPKYCYNWSFVGEKVVVANLWHEEMVEKGGIVRYILNPREMAKNATGVRVARAQQMDLAIRQAMTFPLPIRVIINAGSRKQDGHKTTSVKQRLLDPVVWNVEAYDEHTGRCTLARRNPQPTFIDQFTAWKEGSETPRKKLVTTEVSQRCSKVRREVLARANGYCEYCKTPGFTTHEGIFLETHHVIPLSEDGPDTPSNVVALCPNHHREAHYGVTQHSIRQQLLAFLKANARPTQA
ncbi:HNH endonuclease [Halomonas sp. ANAO-440]|uniref:HNH endonuclease n=1 Tax=Halomonas sp. ANAO-440 TaxID=2861360 RepID=UPI0021CD3576|nr:HNH endonuclease [Halomonas sp. ANAO-440]